VRSWLSLTLLPVIGWHGRKTSPIREHRDKAADAA
jgi:hypothetical protein